ncbi:MAG TPA: FdtA/QdtA family cupin domain-containing protein [Gemmatimonadales bacterium]
MKSSTPGAPEHRNVGQAPSRAGEYPSVHDCEILQFPKVSDHRGNLTFVEEFRHVPFDVRRVFYVYDIPSGEDRGAHAHRALHQVIVCLSGGLDVHLDDGVEKRVVHLNRPWLGLHVRPMIWAAEGNFDPGTVYIVLASDYYDEADYIRDYSTFVEVARVERRPSESQEP